MFRVMLPRMGPKVPQLPGVGPHFRREVARKRAVHDPTAGETTFLPLTEAVPPPPQPDPAIYSRDRVQYPRREEKTRWDGLCDHLLACFPVQPRDSRPIDLVATVAVPAATTVNVIQYVLPDNAEGLFTAWGMDSPGGGLAFALWDLMRNGSAVDNMFSQFIIDFGTLTDLIEVNYEIVQNDTLLVRCTNTNLVAPITARARLKGWYAFT